MGPTCLFRRSQRVVERRRVCVVELATVQLALSRSVYLVFYTLCLLYSFAWTACLPVSQFTERKSRLHFGQNDWRSDVYIHVLAPTRPKNNARNRNTIVQLQTHPCNAWLVASGTLTVTRTVRGGGGM